MQLSKKTLSLTKGYESNPNLKTILPESDWQGTPIDEKGNFINVEFPFEMGFADVFKLFRSERPQAAEKKADEWRQPVIENQNYLTDNRDVIVWLGHASFFIRLNGKTLLIDPVFNGMPSLPRLSKLPLNPSEFRDLDYILVSHNHRDHCDKKSLKLLAKNNPNATYLTSLRLDKYLKKWTKSSDIQTAGWYQQYETDGIDIFFLPSRHWCRRYLWDLNTELWGAFVIRVNGKTIYFSGDTGKGEHLKEVGELFDIDYCLIGVGAYSPEWFMKESHVNPSDAFDAAKNMNAKTIIPMHFGTFDLSFEPVGEPLRVLKTIAKREARPKIKHLTIGDSFWI
jgi:L-ascorbate metabolism protein UlaG (beta-lactamase superfamily)